MDTPKNDRQEKIAAAKAAYLQDLRASCESPAGKFILAHLHAAAATDSPSYVVGGNPNDTFWRDGRKSIVLEIERNLKDARADYGKAPGTDKPPATGGTRDRRKGG